MLESLLLFRPCFQAFKLRSENSGRNWLSSRKICYSASILLSKFTIASQLEGVLELFNSLTNILIIPFWFFYFSAFEMGILLSSRVNKSRMVWIALHIFCTLVQFPKYNNRKPHLYVNFWLFILFFIYLTHWNVILTPPRIVC